MAKSTSRKSASRKPTQSVSKVAQAKRKLVANQAPKNQQQIEREKEALEKAKLEEKVKAAYQQQYRRTTVALAKQAAKQDAARDAAKQSRSTRKDTAPKGRRKPK